MHEPKSERIIMPASINLSGLLNCGANVAAPLATPPQPVQVLVPVPVPAPSPRTMEDEVREELAAEDKKKAIAQIAADARTRLFKAQEKIRLAEEWDAETKALLAAREPHPMELTPMEKLRMQTEREKHPEFYDSWKRTWE